MSLKDLIIKPIIATDCLGGEPCLEEERPKVEVYCGTCKGDGHIPALSYPDGKEVKILCFECMGEGHYEEDAYVE